MNKQTLSMLALIGTVVAALTTANLMNANAQDNDEPQRDRERQDQRPRLSVSGSAELDRPADRMVMRLGVVTEAKEATQAMQQNSRRMNAVIDAMKQAGITEREYQTGRFNVQPVYSHPPRQHQGDWRPEIVAYRVHNTLDIKTQKLELAGQLIQAATEAGANTIDSINFDLADRRKHRAEAIREATQNAISDAEALAAASNQRLMRVLSITLDHADPRPPVMYDRAMRGMAMEAEVMPPIAPGDVTVRATVNIVYQIESLN